jgi:inner membrane protein
LFDKAEFVIGIDDLRGIEQQVVLNWNNEKVSFNPGVSSSDIVESGINALIPLNPNDSTAYNFSLNLDLKGSQTLYFTPVGKVTDITLSSEWPDPSFNGAFLPDTRDVNDKGFSANWNVLHLNRNYPQIWKNNSFSIAESSFGIDLLLPVDNYQKSYRSIQYAILFIGFTFLVFFFIEVLNKVFIHPIQYILVGVALVVFYTLLLSISEHLEYNLAFAVSAFATLLLIAGYVRAILKSGKLTLLISGILTVLYSFIFVIIQLQDYALLIGSIGIFLILGLVMYFSRKIDWYNLNFSDKKVMKD